MTRSHVHVLAESGRSHADIADQRDEAPKRGRPSKADGALVARVWQLLVDEPGLRATEVYRRAVAWGSAGKRSAMSEPARRLRPAPTPDLAAGSSLRARALVLS